jgi:hypothetical protein
LKEEALKLVPPLTAKQVRYKPPEGLLRFLQGL